MPGPGIDTPALPVPLLGSVPVPAACSMLSWWAGYSWSSDVTPVTGGCRVSSKGILLPGIDVHSAGNDDSTLVGCFILDHQRRPPQLLLSLRCWHTTWDQSELYATAARHLYRWLCAVSHCFQC